MSDQAAQPRQPRQPRIDVLLATFNGDRFLHEQLASIFDQRDHECHVFARDDGSTDRTLDVLAEFRQKYPGRLEILDDGGKRLGAKANFTRLLGASTAPYVLLADQDDVWRPDKVKRSLAAMAELERQRGSETPLLVFTDLEVVDEGLQQIAPSFWQLQGIDPRRVHQLARLVRQNVVTGCTTLLNRPLVLLARRIPEAAFMHDWWIALLACVFGAAGIVTEPTVAYRQHDRNTVGIETPERRRLVPRWRYHDKRREEWEISLRQARALLEAYDAQLPPDARRVLQAFVQCEEHDSRAWRVATLLRHGFLHGQMRRNLGTLWYLWDMRAAKRSSGTG